MGGLQCTYPSFSIDLQAIEITGSNIWNRDFHLCAVWWIKEVVGTDEGKIEPFIHEDTGNTDGQKWQGECCPLWLLIIDPHLLLSLCSFWLPFFIYKSYHVLSCLFYYSSHFHPFPASPSSPCHLIHHPPPLLCHALPPSPSLILYSHSLLHAETPLPLSIEKQYTFFRYTTLHHIPPVLIPLYFILHYAPLPSWKSSYSIPFTFPPHPHYLSTNLHLL